MKIKRERNRREIETERGKRRRRERNVAVVPTFELPRTHICIQRSTEISTVMHCARMHKIYTTNLINIY